VTLLVIALLQKGNPGPSPSPSVLQHSSATPTARVNTNQALKAYGDAYRAIKRSSFWITARTWFRNSLMPSSTQDLKASSRISVVFTPTGPLVYQWQIDHEL
jgi:hypothetical protein